jgi:hypothetical protein
LAGRAHKGETPASRSRDQAEGAARQVSMPWPRDQQTTARELDARSREKRDRAGRVEEHGRRAENRGARTELREMGAALERDGERREAREEAWPAAA